MTFFIVPVVIFCPPLSFLLRKKWLGFFINSIFYLLAIGCLITMVLAIPGVIFWAIAFLHAMWSLKSEMAERHLTMMATKMAAAMRESQTPEAQ